MLARILFLFIFSFATEASAQLNNQVITSCTPTPAAFDDIILPPSNFEKSNNLRKKTGASEFAEGNFIDIEGVILDSNCVPVAEAVVEMWQADANGEVMQYGVGKDANFSYSGVAVTDNLGRFYFFSVLPGIKKQSNPYVNLRVKHSDFIPFETKVYFEDHLVEKYIKRGRKAIDNTTLNLLTSKRTGTQKDSVNYKHYLVLEGASKYKRY
jgi:protocatechuate 3,4-dioxygenase beta subunit